MPIDKPAWFDNGDGRQRAVCDVAVEIRRVLDMSRADGGVGHDGGVVLEGIADGAILICLCTKSTVVELIGIRDIVVPLIAVVLPGNIGRDQRVSDTGHGGWRNSERGVGDIVVGICVVAVAEVPGILVIQQVVATRFAARINVRRQ